MRFDALLNNPRLRLALSPVLLPAAALYAVGVAMDRRLRGARRKILAVPTISVGNLTVGGTGKTPVLLRLVSDLRALGKRPFVLTRGYAGPFRGSRAGVVRAAADAAGFSDEVRLMAEILTGVPIAAGADRVSSAERVLSGGVEDVAVLDDGFQHWKLARDLDIVCLDATDPWGGGFLLPFGRLRESAAGLARAAVVVLTRCERVPRERAEAIAETARGLAPGALILRTRFELNLVLPDGQAAPALPARALAVSAIGSPSAFEANLEALGVQPVAARFGDHHAYTRRDWEAVARRARHENLSVVTTAKDWVKLRGLASGDVPVVLIAAQSLRFEDDGDRRWNGRLQVALASR